MYFLHQNKKEIDIFLSGWRLVTVVALNQGLHNLRTRCLMVKQGKSPSEKAGVGQEFTTRAKLCTQHSSIKPPGNTRGDSRNGKSSHLRSKSSWALEESKVIGYSRYHNSLTSETAAWSFDILFGSLASVFSSTTSVLRALADWSYRPEGCPVKALQDTRNVQRKSSYHELSQRTCQPALGHSNAYEVNT